MAMVPMILGIWTLVSIFVGLAFCLLAAAGRRDKVAGLQEQCRYHEWVRYARGGLWCRRCEWVAGQREAVRPFEEPRG